MASPDKLVSMANQIGRFFTTQPGGKAANDIATHIRKFWDPRMRSAILAHLDAGGAGLDPFVREAVEQLKSASSKHTQHLLHSLAARMQENVLRISPAQQSLTESDRILASETSDDSVLG